MFEMGDIRYVDTINTKVISTSNLTEITNNYYKLPGNVLLTTYIYWILAFF